MQTRAAAAFAIVYTTAASVGATTYQVGPTRSYSSPASVATLLQPGDVVEIDGDATYTGGTSFWNAGTVSLPITIRGIRVNGKRPVLSGGDNTVQAAGDHYVFETLEITGGSSRCFYHHADDITLRDTLVHDCPNQGVLGADTDSGSLLMEYDEVTACGGGLYDHQVYMATDETAHPGSVFRMQYCFVHDGNGGNNVKSRAERNEIYYNWIEGALYHEVELIGPDTNGHSAPDVREDSDVVGNVLVKKNTFFVTRFGGDGTGETFGRYRFVNNTVVVQPNGSAIFRLFDGLQSVEMHNNVYAVQGGGALNMLRDVEANWIDGRQIAGTNNWVMNGASNVPPEWARTLQGDDPGFMNFPAVDVRLTGTSPLVDAGASSLSGPTGFDFPRPLAAPLYEASERTVGLPDSALARPDSTPIDIGAYEWSGTTASGGSGGSGMGGAGGIAGSSGGSFVSASGEIGSGGGGVIVSGGSGGSPASGGSASGGSGALASSAEPGSSTAGASPLVAGSESGDEGSCGCRTTNSGSNPALPVALGFVIAVLRRRRR